MLRSPTEKVSHRPLVSRLVLFSAIGLISILTFLASGVSDVHPAFAQGDAEMRLGLPQGGVCDDSMCAVAISGVFTISVEVVEGPGPGYFGAQSFIDFGTDLIYNMTDDQADEIIWPDCSRDVSVRGQFSPETVNHGCLTGLIPPLPVSTYTGRLVELSFTCSSAPSSTLVQLLPYNDARADTSGAGFLQEDRSTIEPIVSGLTITCAADITAVPTVTPGGPTRTPPATSIKPPNATPQPTEAGSTGDSTPTGDDVSSTTNDDSGDGQGGTILIVVVIIAVVVIGGGGALFFIRRQRGEASSGQE